MNYRIKECAGVFTIQVEKLEYKTLKGKCTRWVDSDCDGQPIRPYIHAQCRCTTFPSLELAKVIVRQFLNESEKSKDKNVIYHEV